jgi:hypothetical protein
MAWRKMVVFTSSGDGHKRKMVFRSQGEAEMGVERVADILRGADIEPDEVVGGWNWEVCRGVFHGHVVEFGPIEDDRDIFSEEETQDATKAS